MSTPGSITWFAHHETRLAWREWVSMMTAGRRTRTRTLVVVLGVVIILMHLVALAAVSRFAGIEAPDKTALVLITGSVLLSAALMLSQAMESVTRVFYARSDFDLVLSSPAAARRLFAVRILTIAAAVIAMGALMAAPFINVLVVLGGAHWLGTYGAVVGFAAIAVAAAVVLTVMLFETIGAKRARLVAQIVAAVIGAGFVIGLQIAAIASTGTLSRFALLASEPVVALAPSPDSLIWWPARALLGDLPAVAAVLGLGLVLLAVATATMAPRFARCALAAAGVRAAGTRSGARASGFRAASPLAALRRKEWLLLARDPWLASQTLMQLLYLLPPAFLLWRSFGPDSGSGTGSAVLLVPVLVMAAGQLAGGLAWLAVSGEDAPELVATAPLRPRQILRAKLEAVLGVIGFVFGPLVVALGFVSVPAALACAAGVAAAAASAAYVQLCFRAQAKRSHFRRRQTSSRIATFAEAFISIGWAAAAAFLANESAVAAIPAVMTLAIMAGVRSVAPRRA